jgi:SNF2 family DNA or RNA helicase
MQFLRENKFGGILADEMGLGKTLQTLAFIQSCHTNQKLSGPVLIVCPTSLIFNWLAEAKKFTPQLKVVALHGAGRDSQFKEIAQSDLVITSYGLIRRDAEKHLEFDYDTLVLDEAQHIKNRQTQNSQAVKLVRAKHRVVLTGTPMENSVLDLWSIFDFLMPGYLGSANDFRERYELPLSKGRDPVLQDRLSRRVRPFIMRRLKRDVAKDLPAKLEQVSFCDLTADQRAVYQQVLEAGRNEVLAAVGKDGFAKSRMVVFTALLRLRQICCDLRLLSLEAAKIKEPSGKLELFGELLEEIIDGGHRALVFSQFTSMLDLLGERLAAESIEFCRLDGSTKNRGAVVGAVQSGRAPVFLISLKAGGVGLNQTAADTLVQLDPWWNPAVEDQATDRAHRIGQRRVVTSYKLIARDTVEEKILKLQQKKREAIQAVFGDETALTEALTWDEVQELLG